MADADQGRCFLVLQGLREDQHEAIEHVLTHHRLAVAAVSPGADGEPRLLGWVTADARAAFACVCDRSAVTADELARALGWTVDRCADALRILVANRLVRPADEWYHALPIA